MGTCSTCLKTSFPPAGGVGVAGRDEVSMGETGLLSSLYLTRERSKGCFVICPLFWEKDSRLVIGLFYFNS